MWTTNAYTVDLSFLTYYILEKPTILPKKNLLGSFGYYREFLHELVKSGGRAKPSLLRPEVDELWHIHILHTMRYAEFCEKAAGKFLHHVPCTDYPREKSSEPSRTVTAATNFSKVSGHFRSNGAYVRPHARRRGKRQNVGSGYPAGGACA